MCSSKLLPTLRNILPVRGGSLEAKLSVPFHLATYCFVCLSAYERCQLQEMIASEVVILYDRDWQRLGSKADLQWAVSLSTGIDHDGQSQVSSGSVVMLESMSMLKGSNVTIHIRQLTSLQYVRIESDELAALNIDSECEPDFENRPMFFRDNPLLSMDHHSPRCIGICFDLDDWGYSDDLASRIDRVLRRLWPAVLRSFFCQFC